MDVIFTVGLFIFCTTKMNYCKVESKTYIGDAFRYYSNALSLEVLVFPSTLLHSTVQCINHSVPYAYSVGIYWRRLSCIISGSPLNFALWWWLHPTIVPTSLRALVIIFHLLFFNRDGASSLDHILEKVPRSLRGDEY